ncbi:MAG: 2-oxoacid:acceptor oxidoreductase subunit alpha, partial [Muribaculaceae bacterium]|nr:2-oxoacid:acceptor oxidoreductase subunit alpha [Muribaculaceae bacterium]
YTRREKIARIADTIPALEVACDADADTLLVGWGGTYGHLLTAARQLCDEGKKVAFAHFRYINPLPANTGEILSRYSRVIVAELNTGQFADYLQARFPEVKISRINKVQGQPFLVSEIVSRASHIMEEK